MIVFPNAAGNTFEISEDSSLSLLATKNYTIPEVPAAIAASVVKLADLHSPTAPAIVF